MKKYPLSWIPNIHGYEFIGIFKTGKHVHCQVKLIEGIHKAINMETGESCFNELESWYKIGSQK